MVTDLAQFEIQEIGVFLRQQRRKTRPEQFPELTKGRRRHVHYVTQSDLAALADISVTTVEQIESGRYPNVNPAVVKRLCQALNLSPESQAYVLSLFQTPDEGIPPSTHIPDSVKSVVDLSEPNPAVLITPRFDIVYWNPASTRLLTDFAHLPEEMRNVVVTMFCIPEMRTVWVDWEAYARSLVAGMRMMTSQIPSYRAANLRLAADMCARDPLFAEWWQEEGPEVNPTEVKDFLHPRAGMLHLYQTVSQVLGAEHLSLIQFTARDAETRQALERM
ncbi:MAG: helix-turn-helix transcriptional regulator [Thermomicrobiales bacterium]